MRKARLRRRTRHTRMQRSEKHAWKVGEFVIHARSHWHDPCSSLYCRKSFAGSPSSAKTAGRGRHAQGGRTLSSTKDQTRYSCTPNKRCCVLEQSGRIAIVATDGSRQPVSAGSGRPLEKAGAELGLIMINPEKLRLDRRAVDFHQAICSAAQANRCILPWLPNSHRNRSDAVRIARSARLNQSAQGLLIPRTPIQSRPTKGDCYE
jgi:hypothetical protein